MLAPPMCFACDRYQQDETTDGHICKAFPEGIPAIIWFSRFDHRNPHDGDYRSFDFSRSSQYSWRDNQFLTLGILVKRCFNERKRKMQPDVPLNVVYQVFHILPDTITEDKQ